MPPAMTIFSSSVGARLWNPYSGQVPPRSPKPSLPLQTGVWLLLSGHPNSAWGSLGTLPSPG